MPSKTIDELEFCFYIIFGWIISYCHLVKYSRDIFKSNKAGGKKNFKVILKHVFSKKSSNKHICKLDKNLGNVYFYQFL